MNLQNSWKAALLVLCLGLFATSCDDGPGEKDQLEERDSLDAIDLPELSANQPLCPEHTAPEPEGVECEKIASVEVLHLARRRGSGVVAELRLDDQNGKPLGAEFSACLHLLDAQSCAPLPAEIAQHSSPSLLSLLVAPGAVGEAPQTLSMVEALINSRPANEKIALYWWGEGVVTQVADFTDDRTRLMELAAAGLLATGPQEINAEDALRAVEAIRGDLLDISPSSFEGDRRLVVVAPHLNLDEARWVPGPSSTRWLLQELGEEETNAQVFVIGDDATSANEALITSLMDADEVGLHRLAHCMDGQREKLIVRSPRGGIERVIEVPKEIPEDEGRSCDPQALADGEKISPDHIRFVFSAPEREIYDDRVANLNKDWFETSIQLWEGGPTVSAKARLRGQSSMDCARKSYSVNLKGSAPRELTPGFADDEFFLIAMCLDDRYLNQITADQLLKELGLFELDFRLVQVSLDDTHKGVYLFMEKPQEELLQNHSRVRSILRRDTDIDGKPPELKYPDDEGALSAYEDLLDWTKGASGEELVEGLRERMDLRQYLRWIALMSALGNGDYVDEVYWMSTEANAPDGSQRDYFTVTSWDPDDLFSVCHHSGRFAIEDQTGLLYCTESVLDHAFFAHMEGYTYYAEVLEEVMAQVTQEHFDATLDATVEMLLKQLSDDEARMAMVELLSANPGASNYEEAARDIRAAAQEMKASFATRRAELESALEAFKAQ